MWLFNKKRAELVAQSISQLIHLLSAGREDHGPTGPEKLLRGLAPFLSEDTIIGQRVVKLLVAMAGKARFFVSLATAPDHSGHRLTIDGRGVYSGFSLACALPPRTLMIDLQPSAVGYQARLLYAACKTMPNVVERRVFDENGRLTAVGCRLERSTPAAVVTAPGKEVQRTPGVSPLVPRSLSRRLLRLFRRGSRILGSFRRRDGDVG